MHGHACSLLLKGINTLGTPPPLGASCACSLPPLQLPWSSSWHSALLLPPPRVVVPKNCRMGGGVSLTSPVVFTEQSPTRGPVGRDARLPGGSRFGCLSWLQSSSEMPCAAAEPDSRRPPLQPQPAVRRMAWASLPARAPQPRPGPAAGRAATFPRPRSWPWPETRRGARGGPGAGPGGPRQGRSFGPRRREGAAPFRTPAPRPRQVLGAEGRLAGGGGGGALLLPGSRARLAGGPYLAPQEAPDRWEASVVAAGGGQTWLAG